jgi:hypothetical protein
MELVVAYWSIYLHGLEEFSEPVISLAELIPKFINADLKTEKDIFKNSIKIVTAYLSFEQFSPVPLKLKALH